MNRRIQGREPWADISSLEAAVNSLFEDRLSWANGTPTDQSTLRVDVLETASRFEIVASVPGLQPEDVSVTVLADSVRIVSEGPSHPVPEDEPQGSDPDRRWLVRERYVGHKERTITLPTTVIADDVTASFQDGVLRVVLPKADTATARRIQVTAGTDTEAERAQIDSGEPTRTDDA